MRSGVYITCSLLLLSGCVQGDWRQAVARAYSRDSVSVASRERVEMVEKLLDDAPVPRASVPLLRAQSQDQPSVTLTSSSAEKTPAISHDATTLALIEKETRSFSPADRDRAVAALKAIPSESVPAVLQLWKAGLISPLAHPTSPVILAPTTAADLPAPKTMLASFEEPQVDIGMGQKSPWQTHGVHRADYHEDHNGPLTAGTGSITGSQITRVSKPIAGYSSPFPTPDAANGFQQQSTGSFAASRTGSRAANSQSTPADWQSASTGFSQSSNPNNGFSTGISADSGRKIVNPSDWQSNLMRPAAPQFSPPSSQASPQAFSQSLPVATPAPTPPRMTAPDGPVIRPATRGSEANVASPPAQRRRYSDSVPPNGREIALVPGQPFPGFEAAIAAQRPLLPPPSQHQLLNHEATPAPAAPVWQTPARPVLPNLQSSGEALQSLIRATESEVAQIGPGQSPEQLQYYLERQVYLRLLYLMSGQTELALRPIPNVPAADQEFWTQVLWGVHNYFDLTRIPNHSDRAAQTISQFNTAMLRLKERAPLELKNVVFCHKIDGYGEYETYTRDEFTPGQRVLVYAEIGNFHSELSAEGIYRTRLKSTLQVISNDSPQEPVDVKSYPVTEDYCRNHRRDYFHSYMFEIPVRCARGSHMLKLIIEDELSGKVVTYPVSFVVR